MTLFLTHSSELGQYLNSQVVPAINETMTACSEADAASSEIGIVNTSVIHTTVKEGTSRNEE